MLPEKEIKKERKNFIINIERFDEQKPSYD